MRIVRRFRVMAFLAIGLAATPAWAAARSDGDNATTAGPMVAETASEPDCLVMRESQGIMTGVDSTSPDDVAVDTGEDSGAAPDRLASSNSPQIRSWIPSDAEREDDRGALTAWVATDAEREDDTGIPSNWIRAIDCDSEHRAGRGEPTRGQRAPGAPAAVRLSGRIADAGVR